MKKRLKLPNGFGSITRKADGRRRKPYVVRKTIGLSEIVKRKLAGTELCQSVKRLCPTFSIGCRCLERLL